MSTEIKERDRRIIKEMPDKETLEEFINGMSGPVRVIFNVEKGRFEWPGRQVEKTEGVGNPGGDISGAWKKYPGYTSQSRYRLYVKDVVDAYTYSHGIVPRFVLTNDIKDPMFGRDNPGWMFVRQETNLI